MRVFRAGFAALAFGAAFTAGCSQGGSAALAAVDTDPKAVEALVAKLATESFKGKSTAAADIAAVRDVLPKEVDLTWGNLSFDAASGATVLTDVKLTPKDMPTVGLGIDELRLFDFDAAFAKARLTGQRLTETAPLASRIDAKGVAIFGVAQMLNQSMGGAPVEPPVAADPTAPVDPNAPPADWLNGAEPSFEFDGADFGMTWDSYDFSFGRLILNDIVLRPFELVAPAAIAPGSDAFAPAGMGGEMIQQYIAVMRSFGIDTFATYDMKGSMGMTQMGQKIAVSFGAKSGGTRGWRGGDFDASYARDIGYAFSMGGGDAPTPAMNMNYSIGYVGTEDTHLDKLYGYMAKGIVPPRTETDLMSLGSFVFENQKLNVAGKDIMTIGESTLDARKFHWFIPTSITASAKNAVFDVGAMMQMAESFSSEFADVDPDAAQFAPAMPDFTAIMAALEKNGLSKPNLNFNFGWNWNATSGDTKIDLGMGGEKLLQFDAKYEGGFPSFKAVSDLIPDNVEQADQAAIANLFDAKSTLKLVDLNITDNGGLAKIFDLTAELAPIMAASDPSGVNPLEGQTGASLRQMAGGMITMFGASPDIAHFATPFGAFITQGGKLHIGLKPSQPMTFSALAASMMGSTASPGQTLTDLGFKVEHSK
jgi:hypothetical protein